MIDMKCPACDWEMRHLPNDQIANWICQRSSCGYMATDSYMNNLTKEDIAEIKKGIQTTKRHREQQRANREINAIEHAIEVVEKNETVYDIAREHQNISRLTDFIKE